MEVSAFDRGLRPVTLVLKAVGIFPFNRQKTGRWQFRPLSAVALYSVCVYGTVLTLLWFTMALPLGTLLATHKHFGVTVFVSTSVSYFLIVLVLPVVIWAEARNVALYLNDWERFQESYFKVTGHPLTLNLKRRSAVLSGVLGVFVFSFEIIYQLTNGDEVLVNWWIAVKEWYLDIVRFYLVAFWHLIGEALSTAASNLWQNFHKELESRRAPDAVAPHRGLWLQLSRLLRDTGNAMSCTLGFYILYMFLTLTFFVYHTTSNLAQQLRVDLLLMALECAIMAFVLFVVCDSANKATLSVGDRFRDGILTARLSANDMYVKEQLDLFLTVISTNPPRLSLGGFVIVNRALFVSLGSMMTTYLIVLLQFNLSSDEDTRLYNVSLQI